jgi:hypothetical protein
VFVLRVTDRLSGAWRVAAASGVLISCVIVLVVAMERLVGLSKRM